LVPQKGIHLIRHSVHHMAGNGAQFVLLGSGHADGDFRGMAENEYKDSDAVK
jgi:starch synthase